MANYNFLEFYYPTAAELEAGRSLEMRTAVATLIRSVYPTVDTSPNTPFGDLFVSPAGPAMNAQEVATNRLLSDLDPENVESGTVFNCGFERQFLLNFGIQDESTQRSYGLIRLVFSDALARELDRSTTFQVGDGLYRPFAPQAGAIYLLPPGEQGTAGTNFRNYAFYSADGWVIDLLVMGVAGQLASAGATLSLDRTITGLTSAVALSDFMGGTTPTQLQELARRVRSNFYSRTPTTRGGATNMVHQQFPEITLTGATVSGDFEMLRDANNPLQVAAGRLDLMVRSVDLIEDQVTVRLRQMRNADGDLVYAGWMDLPETPIRILSIKSSETLVSADIYSTTVDPATPGLTAAYGQSERLFASVIYAEDEGGQPIVRTELDADGVYADFLVTYNFDPALKICQEFLLSDENVPAGLDLYVRWFVPVEITAMDVDFNRRAGTTLNLEAARSDILLAYNSSRFEQPAGAAAIDSAFYYAGAHSVNSVDVIGYVRYSVAGYVWLGDLDTLVEPTDSASWTTFLNNVSPVPSIAVTSVYMPQYTYVDTGDSVSPSTFAVSGDRNVSYLLTTSALKLTERRSV